MLKKIELQNFRSHKNISFELSNLTLIVGPNGVGKTNILEAISLASTTRSWRTKSDIEVISYNKNFAKIQADDVVVVVHNNPYKKEYAVSGVRRIAKEVVGTIKTVLFEPEDLLLVLGSPAVRRHFLNVVLSQSDRNYSDSLVKYRQVVMQRNKLLKRIRDKQSKEDELNFWDKELAILANQIWLTRSAFISLAQRELPKHYVCLSQDNTKITIKHETHPAETERLEEEQAALREREIMFGQTIRGPHRDDFIISFNNVPARSCASRGEVRSLVFGLKMVELDFLSKAAREDDNDVVLLLDDVMSELDHNRRERLVEVTSSVQTVLTTTDLDHVPKVWRQKAKIIELK